MLRYNAKLVKYFQLLLLNSLLDAMPIERVTGTLLNTSLS